MPDLQLPTSNFQLPTRATQRILVIGLSNIGDAILMSPVVAQLSARYPDVQMTLCVGERAGQLFVSDPRVHRVVGLEEFAGLWGRLRLALFVWRVHPDLLVDLRQTMLPLVWKPWRMWRYFWPVPPRLTHRRARHLWKLNRQAPTGHGRDGFEPPPALPIGPQERDAVDYLVRRWGLHHDKRWVVVSPGARSHIKRWPADRFAKLADRLIEDADVEVIFCGESDEAPLISEILGAMGHRAYSAAGSMTIRQAGALMQRASLVVTNDSAALHLACAVGAPVVAIFGPTDPHKYGPTGPRDRVVQRKLFCVPCEKALCRFNHECMRFIPVDEVYAAAKAMLEGGSWKLETGKEPRVSGPSCLPGPPGGSPAGAGQPPLGPPQRILVIRLDRIGDVVLSTPVLEELRKAYPQAFIAMMVRPVCRDVVEGNPFLNEVILYEKETRHASVWSTIAFALSLRRHRFDTALVLHPTNRSHWIPWLAGIPVRIGWDRKSGWLLTHRVPHLKQQGTKHEADYTLELLRSLGIEPSAPRPMVPIHPEADRRIGTFLNQHGIGPQDRLVAIHPSASDQSKRWPADRFAHVADRLIDAEAVHVVLIAGPGDVAHAQAVEAAMRHRPLNAAGKLSVGELACLLKRARLLISNDSGPVHLAAAVGTPVVAIFGRNQPGLSATRWGPLGPGHMVLQKAEAAGFSYITELTVEEVYRAAAKLLAPSPTTPRVSASSR